MTSRINFWIFLFCFFVVSACQSKSTDINNLKINAEKGDANAQYNLGILYYEGFGDTLDYKEALKWLIKASEQGNVEAQFTLGSMYENGRGTVTDYNEAAKCYKKAYEQGHPEASFALANMHNQEGSVRRHQNDIKKATKWYQIAAEEGHIDAQFVLGNIYFKGNRYRFGEEGVLVNIKKAVKWYRKAAEQGHPTAPLLLARITIEYGKEVQNPNEVVKWLWQIVQQGKDETMYEAKFHLELVCHSYPAVCK